MSTRRLPDLVVHADWGSAPAKRWAAAARLGSDGRYRVTAPAPVGPLDGWLASVAEVERGGRALVGFDFPIGLPEAYARRAGIADFREALLAFGSGRWSGFYDLAEQSSEVELFRPFYPRRPGGTRRTHLVDGLGLASFSDLLRRCDRPTPDRRAGGALFWTMGAQQSGRAAIVGWRDVIAPALRDPSLAVRLWPFDGGFDELLGSPGVVVAEAYPAEAALMAGLPAPGRGWSKRSQSDRSERSDRLLGWAHQCDVILSDLLVEQVADGFGAGPAGEDAFDAVVGLFGMLHVVLGRRRPGVPDDAAVRRVEGWILGLQG